MLVFVISVQTIASGSCKSERQVDARHKDWQDTGDKCDMSDSARVSEEMNGPRWDCDPQSTVPCKPFISQPTLPVGATVLVWPATRASAVLSARESSITITLHNDLVAASNPDTAFTYSNQHFPVSLVSTANIAGISDRRGDSCQPGPVSTQSLLHVYSKSTQQYLRQQ